MNSFLKFARDRQRIFAARAAGESFPWTTDPILQEYRFTNVYRENDATTVWFRENVRDPLRDKPEVLLATVLFRWFNRIRTGEAIFRQTCMVEDPLPDEVDNTPWEVLLQDDRRGFFPRSTLQGSIVNYCGNGPYVTGAYIIKTPDGMTKLDGVLQCVEWFCEQEHPIQDGKLDWREVARVCLEYPGEVPLETVWDWLRKFPFLGDFMAYEIVSDLRHTLLLDKAPDIDTWANPGPGAMRGLNRLHGRDLKFRQPKHVFVCEMRSLLAFVHENWCEPDSPLWEMREVEHTLCEFDKYERVRLGQGRPRGRFRA